MGGQVKNLSKGHLPTGAQMDRQVRTQKETKQVRGTYSLESIDRQTSQDTKGNQASKGHSLSEEHRQTDKSGHEKNPSKQGVLTDWRAQMDRHTDKSGHGKNLSKQGALTH